MAKEVDSVSESFSIPKPDSNILHWSACFASCFGFLVVWMSTQIHVKQLIRHQMEDELYIPYSRSNPFACFLAVFFLVGVFALFLHGIIKLFWKLSRLPSPSVCKRRLRTGRSVIGHGVAHIAEQFDDCMIDGILGKPKFVWGALILGPLMLLVVISRYLWLLSVINTAPPFAQAINYAFVVCIPTFSLLVLRDPLHFMKLVAAVMSFFGIYIHFFGGGAPVLEHSDSLFRIVGSLQAVGAAVLFGLYLVIFRLFNPSGWMTLVLSCQGIGAGLFGVLILPFLGFINEKFRIPTDSRDLHFILVTALWNLPVWYFINEATRWGEPSAIASAFVIAPTGHKFVEVLYGYDSTRISREDIIATALTMAGFSIDALYQLFVALRRRRDTYLAARKNLEDLESEERLIMQGEYTI